MMQTGSVQTCMACFHYCRIQDGNTGSCRTRMIGSGQVVSCSYGVFAGKRVIPALQVPIFGLFAGQTFLQVSTIGCMLRCPSCSSPSGKKPSLQGKDLLMPEDLVRSAASLVRSGNAGIVFAGGEALVNYRYIYDTAMEAMRWNLPLQIAVKTKGMVHPSVLDSLHGKVDLYIIDVLGYCEAAYEEIHGSLRDLKLFIRHASEVAKVQICARIHPKLFNSIQETRRLAKFIASIDPEIPLVLHRVIPPKKSQLTPVTINRLYTLQETALMFLKHVYIENIDHFSA